MTIYHREQLSHGANLPLPTLRLNAEPLVKLWNEPHSVIVAVDLEIPNQVVIRKNAAGRDVGKALKQLEDEIARLADGHPR